MASPLSPSFGGGARPAQARRPAERLVDPIHPLLQQRWYFASPELSVARWLCRVPETGWRPELSRDLHTVTFVHQGSYRYRNRRGDVLADATTATFYNPGEPYTVAHPCGCGDRGSSMVLSPGLVRELLAAGGRRAAAEDDEPRFPAAYSRTSPRAVLLRDLVLLRIAGGDEPLAIEETTFALLHEVVRGLPGAGGPAGGEPRDDTPAYAERAQAAMLTGFHRRLTLDELARAAYTTPYHLCRVFKRATGLTVHRYLTRLRLRTALDHLLTTRGDVQTIAGSVGFATHSHFTAAFRRELGCTPSQVRRAAASRTAREELAARLRVP